MYINPKNEKLATPEVMEKVAVLAEMVKTHNKNVKESANLIREFAKENGLDHLYFVWDDWTDDLGEVDVEKEHSQWLSSNHNC